MNSKGLTRLKSAALRELGTPEALAELERRARCNPKGQLSTRKPRPAICTEHSHVKGCRPGRPLCRHRRKEGLCYCPGHGFPHRAGSGTCVTGPSFSSLTDTRYDTEGLDIALAYAGQSAPSDNIPF